MTDPKPTWPETAGQLNAENGGYDDGLEDAIAEALTDSLEMDWTTRDGARAVMSIVNTELAALRERVRVLEEACGILEDALQEVGDDYPGSSCQKWCQQQVKLARAALGER